MSIALLISDPADETRSRLVPVATQQIYLTCWLPGAKELESEWVDRMETGFDITRENRDAVIAELSRLRQWMIEHLGMTTYEIERLDRLVVELDGLPFDEGIVAFLG